MNVPESVLNIYKTPTAERKLIEIIKWSVRKWGKKTTVKYMDKINHSINLVASGELPCMNNAEFSERFSYITCQSHYIFFEFKEDKVIVATLFHTAMHIKERLNVEKLNLNHEINQAD